MKTKILAGAALLALSAFLPAAAHADATTTATQTTKTVSTDTDATVVAPAVPATPVNASASVASPASTTVTTVTDTSTSGSVTPNEAVAAPSIKGHKPGDEADAEKQAATTSQEATTAGDKAAHAVTPLTDPSKAATVPAAGTIDQTSTVTTTH